MRTFKLRSLHVKIRQQQMVVFGKSFAYRHNFKTAMDNGQHLSRPKDAAAELGVSQSTLRS
jgi:hypothetical protein